VPGTTGEWQLGTELREKIEHSGFKINDKKTRMQFRGSRQVTTGLMVNEKVNIRHGILAPSTAHVPCALCYRQILQNDLCNVNGRGSGRSSGQA